MKKITVSILSVLMMLSMVFSSSVFAANEQPSAWDSFVGLFTGNATTTATDAVGVEYRGHIQNVGNYPTDPTQWVQGPTQLGTVGQSLRLEGFWIQLTNKPANVNIQYRVHVQNVGWMAPVKNGNFAGTEGQSQRIEAIEITLVDDQGNAVTGYSVQYKGHIQNQGDTAWLADGAQLGTTGSSLRLEALEVKIVQTKADMTAYNAALAAVTQADYTAASWTTYKAVVDANVVTEDDPQAEVDAATAAITAAQANLVKVLKVESASATNLKNILVTFNGEVNKDTVTATNIRVYDGANQVTGLTVALGADNKTAFVTNPGSYTQLKEYKVVVENVATKTDATNKVAKTEKMVTTVDTTLPTVESVTVKSPKTLEILFSEPIQTGSSPGQFPTAAGVTDRLKVDGINAYLSNIDITKLYTENKVTVTLGTAMAVGDHKVVVSGLNDFANLPIATKEFTATVVADTTIPAVTAASAATRDKVTVTFNKPLDVSTVVVNTTIKVFDGAIQKTISGYTTTDNQTFVLNLNAGQELSIAAIVDASVKVKNVKDTYGNEVTTEQVFAFTATNDTTAPAVSTVTVDTTNNSMEVTFSKDVDFTNTGIELYDKDNKKLSNALTVTGKALVGGGTSKSVYAVAVANANTLSGNYTLKFIKDTTKDTSVRQNLLPETTKAVVFGDKVAPTVVSAVFVNESTDTVIVDGDSLDSKITVYFDKAMDNATLLNKANYLLSGQPLADVTGSSLEAASDNKSVTIFINRTSPQSQFVFSTATDLRVIAVKDAAGNTLNTTFLNANLGSGGLNLISAFSSTTAFTSVVDAAKVEAIAKNQIKIYAVSGQLFTNIDPNKILFANAGVAYPTLQVMNVSIASDQKSAVLTLNNQIAADTKIGGGAGTLYTSADAVTNAVGVKTTALAIGSGASLVDKIRPTVQPVDGKFAVTADTVKVVFDEPLTVVNTPSAFVVKDSANNQLVPGTDYSISYVAGNTEIDIQILKVNFSDTVTVALTSNAVLKDVAGNFVNDFAAIASSAKVNTAPTASGAPAQTPVGGTVVADTLNSTNTNMTSTATITAGQATGGYAELLIGGVVVATDNTIAAADTSVTFTLGTTTTAGLQAAITAGGAPTVKLYNGVGNSTTSAAGTTLVVDYVAPTLSALAATPSGTAATVTFSENVKTVTGGVTSGVAVSGAGAATATSATAAEDLTAAATIAFTTNNAVGATGLVTFTFNGTSAAMITDAAGNPLDISTTAAVSVTN